MATTRKAGPKGSASSTKAAPGGAANAARGKPIADEINRSQATANAMVDLHTAHADQNGLFVWSAYLTLRRRGAQLPEELLGEFDAFAAKLMRADTPDEIAKAMRMGSRSGKGGKSALHRYKQRRQTMKAIAAFFRLRHAVQSVSGDAHTPDAPILRQVAEDHGMAYPTLRKHVDNWKAAERKRQQARATPPRIRSVFDLGSNSPSE